MSKTQERETSLFNDIANTTIAGQLESRLKELERNIAVAREFIKMADETYTQVKHEWELLQQDTHATRHATHAVQRASVSPESDEEDMPGETLRFKDTKTRSSRSNRGKSSVSTTAHTTSTATTGSHTPSLGAKPETTRSKETEASTEKSSSSQRASKGNRPGHKPKALNTKE